MEIGGFVGRTKDTRMRRLIKMTDDKKPNIDLCLEALADLVEAIGECYCMNPDEAMGRNPCGYCLGKGILEGDKK